MQGNPYPIQIADLFKSSVIYQMPLYQRQYCWTPKNELARYKDDLSRIFETYTSANPEQIFLGAIVLQEEKRDSVAQSERRTVIDGQQRITTIFLTIAALAEYSYEKHWLKESTSLIKNYMVSKGSDSEDFPLIKPTHLDIAQLNLITSKLAAHSIFALQGGGDKSGTLSVAYQFIKNEIVESLIKEMDQNESKNTFESFLDSFLNSFVIADITLNDKHDPNEVFDRLNTAGQKLGIIDLIRNNVFRPYSGNFHKAETFFNSSWQPFEKRLTKKFSDRNSVEAIRKQADGFFFPFALNKRNTIAKSVLVRELKDLWKNSTSKQMISEMDQYIDHYFVWLEGKDFKSRIPPNYSSGLRQKIIDLHQLKIPNTLTPFLMRCLFELKNGNLTEPEVQKTFEIIESFLFRRSIVFQEEGTGYHAIFKRLWADTKGDPLKVRNKMPTRTKEFPDDKQFVNAILSVDIYKKKFEKYCLLKYEEHLANQTFEIYPEQVIETTDHISPQSTTGLKKTEKEEHLRTLHLWGNLLPMSGRLNRKKSNKKVSVIYKELKKYSRFESTINWHTSYSGQGEWTPTLIDDRSKKISSWALTRWKS